jgi:hypothetical protein
MSNLTEKTASISAQLASMPKPLRARKTRTPKVCVCGKDIARGETYFTWPDMAKAKDVEIIGCTRQCVDNHLLAESNREKKKIKRKEPLNVTHEGDGVLRDVEPAHHKYGPSSFSYREACAGFKNTGGSSSAAERGTICHAACELACADFKEFPQTFELDGKEVELDKFEAWNVRDALVGVNKILAYLSDLAGWEMREIYRERKLSICEDLTFGTADLLVDAGEVAAVIDYKFGIHEVAPASDNPQGIAYGIGACGLLPEAQKIAVAFIQPKLGTVDLHVFDRAELLGDGATRIKAIVARANAFDNGELREVKPTSNCQYCARIGTCEAVAQHALVTGNEFATVLEKPQMHDPSTFSEPEHFTAALELASILEKWVPEVRKKAKEAVLEAGMEIPGYEIVDRKVPRKLQNLSAIWLYLETLGVDQQEFLDTLTMSLTQMQKLVKGVAPKGEKAKLVGQVEQFLEDEGHVSGGDVTVPQLRKKTKGQN